MWFSSRLVFISDRVRVMVIVGVIRALMTLWKSKKGVVSRVASSMESESEKSECFHFLAIPLITQSLTIYLKLHCRSWKRKLKIKPITSQKVKVKKTETMAATGLVGILAAVHLFQLLCFIMPVNRHKMFRHGSLLGTEPFKRVLEKRLHGKTS